MVPCTRCRAKSVIAFASGVRRIEAVTGRRTLDILRGDIDKINELSALYKSAPDQIVDRARQQMDELREAKRTIEQYKAKESAGGADSMLSGAKEIGGLHVVTAKQKDLDANALRQLGDVLRDKDASVVAVIASVSGEKITLQCVCGKDAVAKAIPLWAAAAISKNWTRHSLRSSSSCPVKSERRK